jgi:hypothetical protein
VIISKKAYKYTVFKHKSQMKILFTFASALESDSAAVRVVHGSHPRLLRADAA